MVKLWKKLGFLVTLTGFLFWYLPGFLAPALEAAEPLEGEPIQAAPAQAEPVQAMPVRLALDEILKKAIEHNQDIKMKDQDVRLAESKLAEVRANMGPTISTLTLVAPIYKDLGNPLTNKDDKDKWGPLFKNFSTIIQPIYAFGKFTDYKKAAKGGIEAEKKQRQMTEAEVVFDVKNLYYSAQMALQMDDRLGESEEKLVDVIKRIDDLLKAESGEVRNEDAYKLKVLLEELRQKRELAKKGSQLAAAALAFKSGFSVDTDFNIKSKVLEQEAFTLQPLSHYQRLAMDHRPEMMALVAGIGARKALIEAERTQRLPLFFLGGLIDAAHTPHKIRTRQGSPYAYDPYNGLNAGVGLGMKWDLDFWKVNAKLQGLKAEYRKLIHQQELADKGIPVEVKKAYLEFQEAFKNMGHADKQQQLAKKWFLQSVFAWSFGIGDSREVLESVIFKGFSDKNYYDALLNHNVAIGSLTKATGVELLPRLQY